MKITNEKMEISPTESIPWEDVKRLRLLNQKLALVLNDDHVVEFSNLRPSTIDSAFRAYENFLRKHPEKRVLPKKPKKRTKSSGRRPSRGR